MTSIARETHSTMPKPADNLMSDPETGDEKTAE